MMIDQAAESVSVDNFLIDFQMRYISHSLGADEITASLDQSVYS